MPVTRYDPRKIVREVIKVVAEEEVATPTRISERIGLDRRTVTKYVELCEDLEIIKCKDIASGEKTIKVCYLTDHGRKIFERGRRER
jgi:predicted transcriptional regulator